jgi:hypothetical protein
VVALLKEVRTEKRTSCFDESESLV